MSESTKKINVIKGNRKKTTKAKTDKTKTDKAKISKIRTSKTRIIKSKVNRGKTDIFLTNPTYGGDRPGIRQIGTGIILTVAAGFVLCILYQLTWQFTLAVIFMTLLFLPFWIHSYYSGEYEKKRLLDAQIYMEQLLYTFPRQEKLLSAIQEVLPLFPDGVMHKTLEKAVDTILYDLKEEDSLQSGLFLIENAYRNERLCTIHRFLYKAEMLGGDYEGIIALLRRDLSGWRLRIALYQKECRKTARNIVSAIVIALSICMITGYLLPDKVSIEGNMVRMVSTVALLFSLLLIYTGMNRRLAINWLLYGYGKEDGAQEKRYERFRNYREKKEQRTSLLLASLPIAVSIYAVKETNLPAAVIGIFLSLFLLNQHKIGHYLMKKNLTREIEKAFPKWLMELSLLLQLDNVQVAIMRSMEQAPAVLRPALREFQKKMEDSPESVQPYLEFLYPFSEAQIQSAMKMLYAVSAGNSGSEKEQMEELIARNMQLMNRAEALHDEDSLAGMYLLFLAPALIGAMKLICDMTVFLIAFFGQVSL